MLYPIHDLYLRPLDVDQSAERTRIEVLRYSDHLLRRFGLAELTYLEAGQEHRAEEREVADEVWALLEGVVEFSWEDKREHSPTRGATHQVSSEGPMLVLVPFGVQFSVRALSGRAELLRFATHESDED